MKAVLISIQPKWCEKIASGEKTIEVRKTRPKLETPFKCYIYCTIGNGVKGDYLVPSGIQCGKVIGEFGCEKIDEYTAEFVNDGDCYEDLRRHWIDDDGEEDFEIITSNDRDNPEDCELFKNSFISYAELKKYIGENFHDIPFYGWHISNLKIYDKPKELSEFYTRCNIPESKCKLCDNCYERLEYYGRPYAVKKLTRPPQSWMYVEVQ